MIGFEGSFIEIILSCGTAAQQDVGLCFVHHLRED